MHTRARVQTNALRQGEGQRCVSKTALHLAQKRLVRACVRACEYAFLCACLRARAFMGAQVRVCILRPCVRVCVSALHACTNCARVDLRASAS